MNCQEVMELMQRDLDGDLSEAEKLLLNAHLPDCPDCAAMCERLRQIAGQLVQLPKVMPPASIVDAILPKLAELEAGSAESVASREPAPALQVHSAAGKASKRSWFSWRLTGGVAAAALLLGIGLMALRETGASHKNADGLLLTKTASSANTAAAPQIRKDYRMLDSAASPQTKASDQQRSGQPADAGGAKMTAAPMAAANDRGESNAGNIPKGSQRVNAAGTNNNSTTNAADSQPKDVQSKPSAQAAAGATAGGTAPKELGGNGQSAGATANPDIASQPGATDQAAREFAVQATPAPGNDQSAVTGTPAQKPKFAAKLATPAPPPVEVLSPGGDYVVLVDHQAVAIMDKTKTKLIFRSAFQWGLSDQILLEWLDNLRVKYTVIRKDIPPLAYIIDLAGKIELKADAQP